MKVKEFFLKHERALGFAFLISGFIFDNLTLKRVDYLLDNVVLLAYLVIIALGIVSINLGLKKVAYLVPYVMQFAFGGLFSGYLVFYFRSAAFSVNWPFLLMLALFFIGNEFLRKHYEQLTLHLSIFFFAVFSYAIFSLPVVFRQMGAGIFLLSGVLSLGVVIGLVYLIQRIAPQRLEGHYRLIVQTISSIYLLFNLFYFANIIPPIPLSLKEAGIYHSVQKLDNGDYLVSDEKREWYEFFKRNDIHALPGQGLYAYSAVFAPSKLESQISHRWSYYDESEKRWREVSRVNFPITGGRDNGYRGYSVKEIIPAGRWRVDVLTDRDQIIGRTSFRLMEAKSPPILQEKVL